MDFGSQRLHAPYQLVIDLAGGATAAHEPIERNPGHDLRVDIVSRPSAMFPDSMSWRAPDGRDVVDDRLFDPSSVLSSFDAGTARYVEDVQQFAVNVNLLLARGRIADPDRRRAAIARQPRCSPFVEVAAAVEPIHDLDVLGSAGDCP